MPNYRYKCECGKMFKSYNNISERNSAECACGETAGRDLEAELSSKCKIIVSTGENFEAFQSPCNTDVIITNEAQRQDDLKRNGCVDARELIPHGKTSLLDANL